MSRYLFFEFPEIDEGKLTRIRAALVREETLCRAAARIRLGDFIRLSVGEEKSDGRHKPFRFCCDVSKPCSPPCISTAILTRPWRSLEKR